MLIFILAINVRPRHWQGSSNSNPHEIWVESLQIEAIYFSHINQSLRLWIF